MLLLNLACSIACANDLIYKQGFQNTALIGGSVFGIPQSGTSTDAVHVLLKHIGGTEQAILLGGDYLFSTDDIPIGSNFIVEITTLPNSPNRKSCLIENNSGVLVIGGIRNVNIECNDIDWNWDEMNWDEGGWQ